MSCACPYTYTIQIHSASTMPHTAQAGGAELHKLDWQSFPLLLEVAG